MRRTRRRRIYRSPDWARGLWLTGTGVTVGLMARVLDAQGLGRGELVAALGFVGVVGYFLIFRVAGSGVRALPDRVRVVNPFATRTIRWSEVRRFDIEPWSFFPGMGTVVLRSGRAIRVFGIQAPHPMIRPGDRHAEDLMAELNGLLAQRAA
jgi:Bacterial PH domain